LFHPEIGGAVDTPEICGQAQSFVYVDRHASQRRQGQKSNTDDVPALLALSDRAPNWKLHTVVMCVTAIRQRHRVDHTEALVSVDVSFRPRYQRPRY
jgi:hypothetical protein